MEICLDEEDKSIVILEEVCFFFLVFSCGVEYEGIDGVVYNLSNIIGDMIEVYVFVLELCCWYFGDDSIVDWFDGYVIYFKLDKY